MIVFINGIRTDVSSKNLQELLNEFGYNFEKTATAKNNEFVPKKQRKLTEVHENDTIEIVSPKQGG